MRPKFVLNHLLLLLSTLTFTSFVFGNYEKVTVLNQNGIKVSASYTLLEKEGKKDAYQFIFQVENISGNDLSYEINKIKNEDGTYRVPIIGTNFLSIKVSNAAGLSKMPTLIIAGLGEENDEAATQKFIFRAGANFKTSKRIKLRTGEKPVIVAKIVKKLNREVQTKQISTQADNSAENLNTNATTEPVENKNTTSSTSNPPRTTPEKVTYFNTHGSPEYNGATAYNIGLKEIRTLDISRQHGTAWSVLFFRGKNQLVYSRNIRPGNGIECVIQELESGVIIRTFKANFVKAISPDENRIFLGGDVYDIQEDKIYQLNLNLNNNYYWGKNPTWLDENRIICYENMIYNGKVTAVEDHYLYLDLNDLRVKNIPENEHQLIIKKTDGKANFHRNFYLKQELGISIYDRDGNYSKTLLPQVSGYPISWFVSSPNLEYLVVKRGSQTYANQRELVLFKLVRTREKQHYYFSAGDPSRYFEESFKNKWTQTNGIGVYASIYEKKINPLNGKNLGPDRSKFIGRVRIIQRLENGDIGFQIAEESLGIIKPGQIISSFSFSQHEKDKNGAWMTVKAWK